MRLFIASRNIENEVVHCIKDHRKWGWQTKVVSYHFCCWCLGELVLPWLRSSLHYLGFGPWQGRPLKLVLGKTRSDSQGTYKVKLGHCANHNWIGEQVKSVKIRKIDVTTIVLSVAARHFCTGWLALKTALWFL